MLRARVEAERAGAGASVKPGDASTSGAGRLSDTLRLLFGRREHQAAAYRSEGRPMSSQDSSHFRKIDFRGNRLKSCGQLIAEVLEVNRTIEVIQLGDNSKLEVIRLDLGYNRDPKAPCTKSYA